MCSPEVMRVVAGQVNRRQFLRHTGMLGGAAVGIAHLSQATGNAQEATPIAAGMPCAVSQVIDLTHTASPAFPMFPGAQQMQIDVIVTVADNGFYKNQLTLDEHTGTHMDAPAHFTENALFADQLPVAQLLAPLAIIDISSRASGDPDSQLTVDDIVAWETANGPIPTLAFVAMNSGWDSTVEDTATNLNVDPDGVPHFPGFHPDATALLVNERNIVGLGVDTVSLDFGASTDFATHVTLLSAGKYGIESLANLATAPASGAFIFVGGPKHLNASGGPTRAIALVP